MEPISIIFSVLRTTVPAISSYLGLVRNTADDIEKLLTADFNSAINFLETATIVEDKEHYIKLALEHFVEAKNKEIDERQVLAYIGWAMCHHLLREDYATINVLSKVERECQLSKYERRKALASDIALKSLLSTNTPLAIIYHIIKASRYPDKYPIYIGRLKQFDIFKQQAVKAISVIGQ